MKIIIGLGNPGKKFERTRHNVGFMVVDALASKISNTKILTSKQETPNFQFKTKFNTEVLEVDNILLVKPMTYMNNSGEAVSSIISFYKFPTTGLYVIHDDLDIELGKWKLDFGKGPKEHNGVISIESTLKSKDFWRVRIGIDNRSKEDKLSGEEYVLSTFKPDELKIIDNLFDEITDEIIKRVQE